MEPGRIMELCKQLDIDLSSVVTTGQPKFSSLPGWLRAQLTAADLATPVTHPPAVAAAIARATAARPSTVPKAEDFESLVPPPVVEESTAKPKRGRPAGGP